MNKNHSARRTFGKIQMALDKSDRNTNDRSKFLPPNSIDRCLEDRLSKANNTRSTLGFHSSDRRTNDSKFRSTKDELRFQDEDPLMITGDDYSQNPNHTLNTAKVRNFYFNESPQDLTSRHQPSIYGKVSKARDGVLNSTMCSGYGAKLRSLGGTPYWNNSSYKQNVSSVEINPNRYPTPQKSNQEIGPINQTGNFGGSRESLDPKYLRRHAGKGYFLPKTNSSAQQITPFGISGPQKDLSPKAIIIDTSMVDKYQNLSLTVNQSSCIDNPESIDVGFPKDAYRKSNTKTTIRKPVFLRNHIKPLAHQTSSMAGSQPSQQSLQELPLPQPTDKDIKKSHKNYEHSKRQWRGNLDLILENTRKQRSHYDSAKGFLEKRLWSNIESKVRSIETHGGYFAELEANLDVSMGHWEVNEVQPPLHPNEAYNAYNFYTETISDLVNFIYQSITKVKMLNAKHGQHGDLALSLGLAMPADPFQLGSPRSIQKSQSNALQGQIDGGSSRRAQQSSGKRNSKTASQYKIQVTSKKSIPEIPLERQESSGSQLQMVGDRIAKHHRVSRSRKRITKQAPSESSAGLTQQDQPNDMAQAIELTRAKRTIEDLKDKLNSKKELQRELNLLKITYEQYKKDNLQEISQLQSIVVQKNLFFGRVGMMVNEANDKVTYLDDQLKCTQANLNTAEKKIEVFHTLNQGTDEALSMWRERAQMQREEHSQLDYTYRHQKRTFDKFKTKFMLNFEALSADAGGKAQTKAQRRFKDGTKLLQDIKEDFLGGHAMVKLSSLNSGKFVHETKKKEMEGFFKIYFTMAQERLPKDDPEWKEIRQNYLIDEKKLKLDASDLEFENQKAFKPSFYHLIKNSAESVLASGVEKLINEEFSLGSVLELIRAILDSKFQEFMYKPEMSSHQRFAEFVYIWMENYTVDPVTKKVAAASQDKETAGHQRFKLLIQLTSKYYNKLWECSTFTEFLENKYSNDEILYYLIVRNFINRGRMLDQVSGAFDCMFYIPFSEIYKLIQIFWSHVKEPTKTEMIRKLQGLSKNKGGANVIELGLITRAFLEEYRAQKLIKFMKIKHAYLNWKSQEVRHVKAIALQKHAHPEVLDKPGMPEINPTIVARKTTLLSKLGLTVGTSDALKQSLLKNVQKANTDIKSMFSNDDKSIDYEVFFSQVKEVWPKGSSTEILELYSNAFAYGNGNVTMESFFLAAQESGFFVTNIQSLSYSISAYQAQELTHAPRPKFYSPQLQDQIEINQTQMRPLIDTLKHELQAQGCYSVNYELESYLDCFKNRYNYYPTQPKQNPTQKQVRQQGVHAARREHRFLLFEVQRIYFQVA